jgi:hypothetical protein
LTLTFFRLAGRENVIAATHCSLGGRVHPQIAFWFQVSPEI